MRFPSERKNTVSLLGIVALLIAAIWLGGQLPGQAVAQRPFGLPSATVSEPAARPNPVPVRYASHHEDEENNEEREELEEELEHMEYERAALETFFGGLEIVEKMGSIAGDENDMAVLAVMTLADEYEPEDKIGLLEEVVAKAPSKAARRIARLSLAEIYNEQGKVEAALEQMRSLIFLSE